MEFLRSRQRLYWSEYMLYIGTKDFEKVVEFDKMMDCIEKAYLLYEKGNFQMPERMHVDRPEGTVLYMPCFSATFSGIKIVSTFPGNQQSGIPVIQGTMILNSTKTGVPLAIIDGALITAYRTGAVGGVGIKYTTRQDCDRLGLIGTGVQGFFQILYACYTRPIRKFTFYDKDNIKAEEFKKRLSDRISGLEINIAKDSREVVSKSDIIITATPSTNPILPEDSALLKGKHFIAIGSYKYEMREMPKALYGVLDDLYIDTAVAAEESGDLIVPIQKGWIERDRIKLFSQAYKTLKKTPLIEKRTTLYKSVGMALFDLLVAEEVYKSALKKGLGIPLEDLK